MVSVQARAAFCPSGPCARGGKLSVDRNGVVVDPWHMLTEIDGISRTAGFHLKVSLKDADLRQISCFRRLMASLIPLLAPQVDIDRGPRSKGPLRPAQPAPNRPNWTKRLASAPA